MTIQTKEYPKTRTQSLLKIYQDRLKEAQRYRDSRQKYLSSLDKEQAKMYGAETVGNILRNEGAIRIYSMVIEDLKELSKTEASLI